MTLAFILAIPLIALAAPGAPARDAGHEAAHHHAADFTKARALLSPAAPVPAARKTNGLSRKDEDCATTGCIDH
jgi:hypothetical protein